MSRPPTPPTGEASNGIVILSPLLPLSPLSPLSPSSTQTQQDERSLFLSSLQAGSTSRSRRRSQSGSNSNEATQLLPPTSSSTEEIMREPEISPEEIRARRIQELTRVQESERTSLEMDLEALRRLREMRQGLSAMNQQEIERERELEGVWRVRLISSYRIHPQLIRKCFFILRYRTLPSRFPDSLPSQEGVVRFLTPRQSLLKRPLPPLPPPQSRLQRSLPKTLPLQSSPLLLLHAPRFLLNSLPSKLSSLV